MQKVTVLCVGKLKERFYMDAAAEYAKRLSRFCQLEIVELPEERLPDKPCSSEELAQRMARWANQGEGRLVFLIGGSFGLHPSVKALSSLRLSMSPMTFPHHLARVMLLEQIYRAYQINAGSRYHK